MFWLLSSSLPEGKKVRIENSTLLDQWLLCVGHRRPHSLCLYSCSGLSASARGLEMFFSLCRNSLEVKQPNKAQPVNSAHHFLKDLFKLWLTARRYGGVEKKCMDTLLFLLDFILLMRCILHLYCTFIDPPFGWMAMGSSATAT